MSREMSERLPGIDLLHPGHMACAGCGERVAMRLALQALGRNTVFVVPACCAAVVDGAFPNSAMGVPMLHTAFETGASVATGVRASLDADAVISLGNDEEKLRRLLSALKERDFNS